ncbi:MAG: adenylyl-sulfate kinase [Bacteroidetes bacterium]|nr:adenylyl-sulfate kinase [Bacteroidota bacterium]
MTNSPLNKNLSTESFLITRQQKEAINKQKAFVIWLTGLSGSGKSTIARNLEVSLFNMGVHTLILDGDNTRMSINRDLDFSATGRQENIRRVAEIAKLLNDAGVVVITAFISPYIADRSMAKTIIGEECFVEVFVDSPLKVCIERDAKGLYKKAINGELKDFTGISSPYEKPVNPKITLLTANESIGESVNRLVNCLKYSQFVKE